MKRAEMNKLIESGQPCAVVEFRNAVARHSAFRDDKTGKTDERVNVHYNVETETDALKISEKLEGVTSEKEWQCPFKKGDKCVWIVRFISWGDKGMRASGQLVKLID